MGVSGPSLLIESTDSMIHECTLYMCFQCHVHCTCTVYPCLLQYGIYMYMYVSIGYITRCRCLTIYTPRATGPEAV